MKKAKKRVRPTLTQLREKEHKIREVRDAWHKYRSGMGSVSGFFRTMESIYGPKEST